MPIGIPYVIPRAGAIHLPSCPILGIKVTDASFIRYPVTSESQCVTLIPKTVKRGDRAKIVITFDGEPGQDCPNDPLVLDMKPNGKYQVIGCDGPDWVLQQLTIELSIEDPSDKKSLVSISHILEQKLSGHCSLPLTVFNDICQALEARETALYMPMGYVNGPRLDWKLSTGTHVCITVTDTPYAGRSPYEDCKDQIFIRKPYQSRDIAATPPVLTPKSKV